MQGAHRRSDRNSARSFFLLPLVLALLALAAFPVFAHAGGIPEYELEKEQTELPGSQSSVKPKEQKGQHSGSETNPKAHSSGAETESQPESKSESSPEEESETSKQGGGGNSGSNDGGGKHHTGGGDKPQSKPQSGNEVGSSQKVATSTAKPVVSSSDGGSSPIVPILIAVAVLAAISIGVVLYRQRGDDSGPGGPDRRVSSPNAS